MNTRSHGRPLAGLAAALLLAGCANMKGIAPEATLRTPPVPSVAATEVAPLAADWWKDFGDPQLDRLIEQALRDSPNLGVARARLRRAQAATEAADASRYPQVNGALDITRQRFSENSLYPKPLAGSIQDTGTLQANANWEIDFFGKNEAALQAALGGARAADADVAAARVVLASNVARTYFQLARLQEQLVVARRTLQQREQQLQLVQQRVSAGLDTTLEQRQSEGAIPEARQQIEALQEQAQTTRNALAALVASQDVPAVGQLPALRTVRAGTTLPALPADLLARRPDVNAARWRVEAASQDVKSAQAQFYPNVNLTAFLGLSTLGLGKLLDLGSTQWGVGPAIRLPIFDAGRLRANLKGRTADLDSAIESYNGAVLEAFHEAGDAVAAVQSVERQQAEQRQAEAAAEGAYDIAVQRYRAGLGTFLNVLSAENAVLAQRRLGVDLAARALDARVALYRALGGGYSATAENVAAH
ncbi:efflux transporter outer membrane subunit [Ramlibacter sp. USB13]|uniref:Efflux transporter outer membrane subunit n=1 Tax=Ramlibacter cellulosilyticus TaxID=2764187 RepID=A0A923MUJ4_9BURK|nr:efflux transporter outer membrane subunit [Ramlibacter cellulosilyticus]MBC5784012.1 efflux transporter outer membrane subunit [Ramlibacter cellulosilyticus]